MRITKAHFENYYRLWDRDSIHPAWETKEEFQKFAYLLKQCRKREFSLNMSARRGSNNYRTIINLNTKEVQIDISYNAYTYLASNDTSGANYSESYEGMRSMFMWISSKTGWEGLPSFLGRQTKFYILKEAGKLRKKKAKKESIFII